MISHRYLALAMLCVGSLISASTVLGSKKAWALQRLLSNEWTEIKEARDELVTARKSLIAGLIKIVEQKENRIKKEPSVRAAIFVMGEMRAVEAIEMLVDHIGFPYVQEGGDEPRPGPPAGMGSLKRGLRGAQKTYPAVAALVKIGEPCLGAVITKIASTENVNERKACLGVLLGLRQRDFIIKMLDDTINNETDAEKRDRLQNSLNMLAQIEQYSFIRDSHEWRSVKDFKGF